MDKIILTQIPLADLKELIKQALREERAESINPDSKKLDKNPSAPPISQKELSEFLKVTPQTIIRWRKKKRIPFMTIGSAVRFDLKAVVEALKD
ncbi:helix-turn-helix domain-containing protein [Ferruginibacter paludis]|uniref:helix-turn-helix domain-containing protein n=1 Tax=Ferruginibacter paludis TaxID=1310417 RepID=UPI0025B5D18D|nr:helix-turn-helix domain-containing protein [Ferruginibacter paludis]MDN3657952.1 helix-turn-helix domain-containing protein [Ferruginibacter paludis]